MNPAAGPFAIAGVLLALGGVFKAANPNDTANALRGVGLPGSPWLVRAGGALEVGIGCVALATGTALSAALVLASYLAFTAFVAVALVRRVPIATCGCFGKTDTPPSVLHVACNVGAAVAALAVMLDPGVAIADVLSRQPLAGVPFVLLLVTGVYLAFLSMTWLPKVLAEIRMAKAT